MNIKNKFRIDKTREAIESGDFTLIDLSRIKGISSYIDKVFFGVNNILMDNNLEVKKEIDDFIIDKGDFVLKLKKELKNDLELDLLEKLDNNNFLQILGKIIANIGKNLNYENITFELTKEYLDNLLENVNNNLILSEENTTVGDLMNLIHKEILEPLYDFLYLYSKELDFVAINTNDTINLSYAGGYIKMKKEKNDVSDREFPKGYNEDLLDRQIKEYNSKSETNYLQEIAKQVELDKIEEKYGDRAKKLSEIKNDLESGKEKVVEFPENLEDFNPEEEGKNKINKADKEDFYFTFKKDGKKPYYYENKETQKGKLLKSFTKEELKNIKDFGKTLNLRELVELKRKLEEEKLLTV